MFAVEKIWLGSYPEGVPAEINPDIYQSLVEILSEACSQYSRQPAFYNLGVTLTYQQMDHYAEAFAAYVQQVLKLKKGDRIALMLPNCLQYPVAVLGSLRAGLIVVNVNPLYTAKELIHQINDAGAETILVLANFAKIVEEALPFTCLKNKMVTELSDLFPQPRAWFFHFYCKYIKRKMPAFQIQDIHYFRQVITQGEKLSLERVALHEQDIAFLQYTGGTTGIAKGAILTHRNLIANVLQAEAWFSQVFQPGQEIMITALPMYHIFSLLANFLFIAKIGGLSVLITNPRDISRMVKDMARFKFSIITGVNTLFNALINHPKFAKLDFSGLKVTLGGAMAVQRVVAEKWEALTKIPLLEAYGLTETSPSVAINPTNLKAYNGTIGLPISSTDIAILDDEGNEVTVGHAGELAVKGPQVMRGYWQNPIETQKVFTKSGWLLTGDIASVNPHGFVSILERKKDMILVSGFNVYPNEIEDVLTQMPGVREAAVIGVPDEHTGEAVKAVVVKSNLDLTAAEVLQFCRKNLTGYKLPKIIEFRNELPKSNVGKILRRALR
ncbi:MAG: long-chain acyl-CoA synthetase [Gammaproteobacteria bacterium]|jgi:long-chain acyl-CoA synthetase|nr:long-chain acyl-CoA synthetase [Gammaproteobacteria bacterium]